MMMKPFCDGNTRRDFLRVGTAGLFGMGVGLPQLLAADQVKSPGTKDVSLIFVFLHGGLSTIDTFDLKPDAPAEFRGEFKPINTSVPGIQICEHLPSVAKTMDHISLIRSFRHHNSDHGPADHYMLTGYFPTAGFNPNLNPNNQRPSHGSIIAKKARAARIGSALCLRCPKCIRALAAPTWAPRPLRLESTPTRTPRTSVCRTSCRP